MAKRKSARVSFLAGVGSALSFVPRGLIRAWLVLLIWPAVAVGGFFYPVTHMEDPTVMAVAIIGAVLLLVSRLMTWGALYRVSVGKPHGIGFGGVQWRATEWRIIGAGLLTGLLSGLIIGVISLGVMMVVKLAGGHPMHITGDVNAFKAAPLVFLQSHLQALLAGQGDVSSWVNLAGLLGMFLVAWIVMAAFCLYLPATVAEQRMVVSDAPGLASGSVVKLMLGIELCALPTQLWELGSTRWALDGGLLASWLPMLTPAKAAGLAEAVIPALLGGVLQPLLIAGFFGYAYRAVTARSPLAMPAEPAAA